MKPLFAIIALSLLAGNSSAARAQSEAQVKTPQGKLTAGDTLEVRVTFEKPAPCQANVFVQFTNKEIRPIEEFDAYATILTGQTTVSPKIELPKDLKGGNYVSEGGYINPCPGYQYRTVFTAPATTVSVKPFADPLNLPTTAEVELSLTQKQFLDTKAAQLSLLSNKIDAELEHNSADVPQLRAFLIEIVDSAEGALIVTEKEYRAKILKPEDKLPALFADFHAQYNALRVELKAPIPGMGHAQNEPLATMKYVQLKTRPSTENLAGTRSPDVTAVWLLIKENIKAYLIVKDTGGAIFNARISSFPPGARIFYKKSIDGEYSDFSSPTNVDKATFDLAHWDFKFTKDGCADEQLRHIDPYQENDPADISVEFLRCKGK